MKLLNVMAAFSTGSVSMLFGLIGATMGLRRKIKRVSGKNAVA